MVFKIGESITKVAKICLLGDLVLTSKDGLKNLFFLGAEESGNDKWKVNFLLSRNLEEEKKDSKTFNVNSDVYVSYSGKIRIDIKTNERIHFSEDLGNYIMQEEERGTFLKTIDSVHKFYSAISIKFTEIKKDKIVFDIDFSEY